MILVLALAILLGYVDQSNGDGQFPEIHIDEELQKLIPPRLLPFAMNLTSSFQALDSALNFATIKPVLEGGAAPGQALIASLEELVKILQTAKFETTFAIGDYATKGHNTIQTVLKAITDAKAAGIQIPSIDVLEPAIKEAERLLKALSCLNPFSCPLGILNPRRLGR